VQSFIAGRINVSPRRLVEPGPSAQQLDALLALAAAAPDHGLLLPWRFVLIPQAQRRRLGEAFACALIERDPSATEDQIETARDKALRAPVLMLAIACNTDRPAAIPERERLVSLGAAIQNLLIGAGGLTSGQAMDSEPLRALFKLQQDELAVCFVNIGTVGERKRSSRVRPEISAFFSVFGEN
jgi:nitroreductase